MSDDRIKCETCCLASLGKKRCMELDMHVDLALPRRCIHYIPSIGDTDTRNGRDRWPGLLQEIEKAREEDRLFHKRRTRGSPTSTDSKPRG